MYRTAKLFGTAETFEWCLANDILATRCQATVGVGEQRTVLVRQEETRCDGVHTDVRSKLRGYFISQESREVGNARFGCRITTHSGHGAESRHGTEIDNRALSRLHHRAEEYLRGDDRSRKIHIQHPFELFHLEVEERAGRDMCVRRTLEFLGNVVPCTDKMPRLITTEGVEVTPDSNGPTSLFFFKTTVEPHIGQVSYFKVISGKVKEGDDLMNADRGSKERIAQLFAVAGQTRTPVTEMVAGDIGATVKLKDVRRGNTLNGKGCDYRFDFIKYPDPKYRRAIKPVNEADAEKMMEILIRMREEDPTWVIEQSKELKQTIVSGQGEFHLRTLKWRIENNDKLPIEYLEPKIPYRETITKAARADYRHKKQSGGAGQFGEVHLIIEPYYEGMPAPDTYRFGGQEYKMNVRDTQIIDLDWGGKVVFVNCIVGGAIDARFLPAILKGIMARMEQGPLTGSYARDVRICVYDGKMHPVDSNEISFMLAGRNAFSTSFKEAGPKILEPVYDVEVSVPADYLGDVMSDLQGRRALIMGMNSEKGFEKLLAKVPLKEMSNYSTSLSSITGGRASFTMKFASYELVPADVQEKLLKAYEATQSEE